MAFSQFYAADGWVSHGRQTRSPVWTVGAGVVAAHVILALIVVRYGYMSQMRDEPPQERVIDALVWRYRPPPPQPTQDAPRQPTINIPVPQITPYDPPMTIEATPSDAPAVYDPGPPVLPTPSTRAGGEGSITGPVSPPAQVTPPPTPRPSIITNPNWIRQPTFDQLARAYPARAAEAAIGGQAIINCAVLVSGLVNDCRATSESPRGEGFGAAAVQLSRYFMLSPRTEDGRVVEGARVNIPLRFQPPAG